MSDDDPNETDNEQRLRLWRGVRRFGVVQWVSLCIVIAMIAGLFLLAIYFSSPPGFLRSRFAVQVSSAETTEASNPPGRY
jgi:hypothetical protein